MHAFELDRGPPGAGLSPLEAAREARRLASEAVRDGHRGIGQGPGPVNVLGVGVAVDGCPADRRDARDIMRA